MNKFYYDYFRSSVLVLVLLIMPFIVYAEAGEDEKDEDIEAAADSITAGYAEQMDSLLWKNPYNSDNSVKDFRYASVYDPYFFHKPVYANAKDSAIIDILILVKQSVYRQLQADIQQYSDDLYHKAGLTSVVEELNYENFYQVKKIILSYNSASLLGAVLIGDIAYARFEHIEKQADRSRVMVNWPCDLYLMDLDGGWKDNDANGIFDDHYGKVQPEIFVSRINAKSSERFGSELALLHQFFVKDHTFWEGNAPVYTKALAYTSNDWCGKSDFGKRGIRYLYGASNYSKIEETTAVSFGKQDYLYQSQYNYGLIQLAAHSNYTHHYLNNNLGSTDVTVTPNNIMQVTTSPLTYNLFCCSALDWTQSANNELGASYIFNGDNTLAIVGSTKTGSMLKFRNFYKPLAINDRWGTSFVDWFKKRLVSCMVTMMLSGAMV